MRMLVAMRAFAVALVLLSGCGEVYGLRPYGIGFLEDREVPPPANADEAVALALAGYGQQTGMTMPAVAIRWWSGDPLPVGGQTATGIELSCEAIWVWTADGLPVGRTALAHEIGHCARAFLEGDPDAQHADPAWWGDVGFATLEVRKLEKSGL